jgi:hypothetical protein
LEDLKKRILEFIDYFNLTMAKPIEWLYSPRPHPDDVPQPESDEAFEVQFND